MRPAARPVRLLALTVAASLLGGCGQRISLGDSGSPDGGAPPPPNPCAGQPCGAPCAISLCQGATGCEAPAMLGTCDAQGQCVAGQPSGCPNPEPCVSLPADCHGFACGVACDPCGSGGPSCTPSPLGSLMCDGRGACVSTSGATCASSPCAKATCGTPCDPTSPNPMPGGNPTPPSGGFFCDGAGLCVAGPVPCPAQSPPTAPCMGLLCGAPCDAGSGGADPGSGDPSCSGGTTGSPSGESRCNDRGECVSATDVTCPASYAPCAQKSCGAPCSICEPGFPCEEPKDMFSCDASGKCVLGAAPCP